MQTKTINLENESKRTNNLGGESSSVDTSYMVQSKKARRTLREAISWFYCKLYARRGISQERMWVPQGTSVCSRSKTRANENCQ